jgi:hypothetical protein
VTLEPVPVAVEDDGDRGVPGLRRDLLGVGPGGDPEGDRCMAHVVDPQRARSAARMAGVKNRRRHAAARRVPLPVPANT